MGEQRHRRRHLPRRGHQPGAAGRILESLTNVNGALFFSANDGIHGDEPWILAVSTSTTTTVSSSPNPSVFGQAVTFTAAVSGVPGADIPTGTVDFKEGATDLTPGGVSLTGGEAIFTTTALGVGSHTITAVYSGDSTFTGSQGNASPQVVNKDTTSTSVLISPSTLVSGQAVAFVAIVSNTSGPFGAPTGTVQFAVDGRNVGSPVTLVNGVAPSPPSRLLATGSPHTVTVTYTNSDGDFVSGSGSTDPGRAKDSDQPGAHILAQPVGFRAKCPFHGHGQLPGSRQRHTDRHGGLQGRRQRLDARRRNTFGRPSDLQHFHPLGRPTHDDRQLWRGHEFHPGQGSDSAAPQVVNKASSQISLAVFPNPAVFGQVISITAVVSPLAPGKGTPTGTVIFLDGSTTLGGLSLTGGTRYLHDSFVEPRQPHHHGPLRRRRQFPRQRHPRV